MLIYIGGDHRGFSTKTALKEYIKNIGYEVEDLGNTSYDEADDYPDFAAAVAKKISMDPGGSRGILICGSGAGVDMVANKFPGVRSALAISASQIEEARKKDDVNILSISANSTTDDVAQNIAKVFLSTDFNGEERCVRRIEKIKAIEASVCESV